MRAAGIHRFGDAIELLELPAPRALRRQEVLLDVQTCGVGNWDEFARTGGWDLGVRPPMALGVEAAGVVAAVGDQGGAVQVGDRVTVHSLPLSEQGAWAEQHIAAAGRSSPQRARTAPGGWPRWEPASSWIITARTGPRRCAR